MFYYLSNYKFRNKIKEIYSEGKDITGKEKEGPKMLSNPTNNQFLHKIKNDPFYAYEKTRLENICYYGYKDYKEVQINHEAKYENKGQ